MQVSVEKVNNVERRLTITVPNAKLEEAFNQRIQSVAQKANIKGFRPGKAPISFIKQQYGDATRKEALSDLIQEQLRETIKEQNLKPISVPEIQPKVIAPDKDMEFEVTFEVMPDIEEVHFKTDSIEKLNVEIKSSDVKHVIKQLVKQYTQWNIVDRPAKEGDRAVIDYYSIFEGESDKEHTVTNHPLEIGSKQMLPGFEEALIGASAGEEKTLKLNFPADFPREDRAGKPVEFVVTVKQVFEAETPAIDESFVKNLGIKSGVEADLENQIKHTLEQERDRLVKEKLKEQVFRLLLDQNPIEVPRTYVKNEARSIHDEVYQHQHDHAHHHHEDEMKQFEEIAKKRVALGVLIAEFAKKAEIKVDKERVNKRIHEIASVYEKPEEVVNWLSSPEQRGGLEAQVMEDQVLEKLIEGIAVSEKEMSYAELKGLSE